MHPVCRLPGRHRAGDLPHPTGTHHRRPPMSDWVVAALPSATTPEVVRRQRLTLAAMCIAQGMTLLDVTIVNTALPSIQRQLHMTPGQLEWVISAYALSLAAFIPLGGALGDRFGRKRLFLGGMVVFTTGSIA
ncbi:MAG: MFS transporter, partial [Acidimicrobiales bacterium]